MDNAAFIFRIATSIYVPESTKKPLGTFIYSARKAEEFYDDIPNMYRPVYGKFSISNDNDEQVFNFPPNYIS